jgi:hypothetical protein
MKRALCSLRSSGNGRIIRETKRGGACALLGEDVIMRMALRCSCDILFMLVVDVIPRILGQYKRWQ